jgi:hypothetical protein
MCVREMFHQRKKGSSILWTTLEAFKKDEVKQLADGFKWWFTTRFKHSVA